MSFEQYRSQKDKFESLYTVIAHGCSSQELIDDFFQRLDHLKKISDTFRRKYLNDRMFDFITELKNGPTESSLEKVYLVGKEVAEIPLTRRQRAMLTEYSIPSLTVWRGNQFEVDSLDDLLNNNQPYDHFRCDKKEITHRQLTPTKMKTVRKLDFDTLVSQLKSGSVSVVDGVSPYLKQLTTAGVPDRCYLRSGYLDHEQLIEEFERDEKRQRLRRLDHEVFVPLARDPDSSKVLLTKDLVKGINEMRTKTVFATPKKIDKLRAQFDADLLNFEIVEITPLEKGDLAYRLTEYGGIVGVAYY